MNERVVTTYVVIVLSFAFITICPSGLHKNVLINLAGILYIIYRLNT